MFDFGEALTVLKKGGRMTRLGWNSRGLAYIELQKADERSKMTLPYLYMSTVKGDLVPWVATNTDLLSTDWHVADSEAPKPVQP